MKKTKKTRRRTVTRQGVVRPEDTGETFADLEKRAGKKRTARGGGAKPVSGVVFLKLSRVRVAEKVFQWRDFGPNRVPSDDHILEMARTVHETKEPLSPILVFPLGDWFYVVDGHHCQSARKFDPSSAPNFDPFERRGFGIALGSSELVGIAETSRARVA